jgi:hypothetical protein
MENEKEYIFYGRVTPSYLRVSFNIQDPPIRQTIESKIGNFDYSLLLNDTDDVIVKINSSIEFDDLPTLFDMVRSFTQSFYDTALLSTGISSRVDFSTIYLPNKTLAQIQNFTPWMPTDLFNIETETLFILKNNPTIRIAILDIKYALLEPDLTPLFAYRAIEGIMNSFDELHNDRNKKWLLLKENLNLTKDFFNLTMSRSVENRHGKRLDQTMQERKTCVYTALITLQRFMHYINSNETKLNDNSFPLLDKDSIKVV